MRDKIKELRKSTGLSQVKFAETYHLPRRTLENWEMGVNEPPQWAVDWLTAIIKNKVEI